MRRPTLRSANYMLLATLLAMSFFGGILARAAGIWGLLTAELAIPLLPVAIILYRRRLPVARTLRLRWPGFRAVALAGLTGLGTVGLAGLVSNLLNPWLNTELLPTSGLPDSGPALVVMATIVLAAPLSEEPLFRGYIYSAYARRSPRIAIVATALLFVFFHLRLISLASLLPLAFALSYVRWRSDSLFPGMALHGFHNSGIFLFPLVLQALHMEATQPVATGLLSAFAVLGAVAFWFYIRTTPAPEPEPEPEEPQTLEPILSAQTVAVVDAMLEAEATGQDPELAAAEVAAPAEPLPPVPVGPAPLRTYIWPLIIIGVIWAVTATQQARAFATLAKMHPTLTFTGQRSWTEARQLTYDIQDSHGQKVGQASCSLKPDTDRVVLICQTKGKSDERGSILEDGKPRLLQVVYDKRNLQILTLGRNAEGKALAEIIANGYPDYLSVSYTPSSGAQTFMRLRPDGLVEGEWPWRLSALALEKPFSTTVDLAVPGQAQALPGQHTLRLSVTRGSRLTFGSKDYDTWTVMLGNNERAIYDAASNHTLLRYDNGVDTYLLTSGN